MALSAKGIDVRQTGTSIVFRAFLQTSAGALLGTGTTVLSIVELQSDGTIKSFDFNDFTFKTTALTTPTLALTHRPSNNAATTTGFWTVALATVSGFTVGGIYQVIVNNSGASPTDQMREFQYGGAEGDLAVTAGATGVTYLQGDVTKWLAGAIPAPNVTGVPLVDDKYLLGTVYSTPATAGIQDINVKNVNNISASAVTTIKAVQGLAVDGVITTLTNLPAITAGWLTATGIAADAITAAKIADGAIDAATFAAGAINAAAIAADAITDAKVASDVTIASVTGAVGSVTGAVGSVTAAITLPTIPTDWIAGAGVKADAVTKIQAGLATPTNITAASGVALTAAYDLAKTAAQAGDAMALTSGERTTLTAAIWAALTSGLTTANSIGKRLVDFVTTLVYSTPPTAAANATAVRTELTTELGRIDAAVSSRMATFSYTTPPTAAANATATAAQITTDHGSGSYVETWSATAERAAIGMAAANLDTQLAALSASTGPGPYNAVVTVNDGAAALQNARVRMRLDNGHDVTLTTNASGVCTFSLSTGTWTVSILLAGYTFTPTTLVVAAADPSPPTYSMTAIVITPSTPGYTTGYFTASAGGVAQAGVIFTYSITTPPPTGGTGLAIIHSDQTATSDVNGLVSMTNMLKGGTYSISYTAGGTTTRGNRTIPASAGDTYALPDII